MQIIFYLLIALTAFYTGSIDKRLKIARSGIITTPLAALSVVGTVIMCYVFFKTWLLFFLLLLAVLRRTGSSPAKIIAAVAVMFLVPVAGIAAGPAGWTALTTLGVLLFLLLLSTAEEITTELYTISLKEIVQVLCAARKTADRLRHILPHNLRFLAAVIEMPVVCSLSVAGVWQMMNWLYTPDTLSATEIVFRLVAITPLTIVLYRAYLHDTKNISVGSTKALQDAPSDTATPLLKIHQHAGGRAV